MEHYINKDALVAEIERRKKKLLDNIICERDKEWVVRTAHQLNRIILFIDDLEVKDVDLEKEVDKWYNSEASKEFENVLYKDIEKCAKHFFELGMQVNNKAQKED